MSVKASPGVVARRSVLSGLLAFSMVPMLRAAAAATPEGAMTLWGPPAGPSITLLRAIAQDRLGAVARPLQFKAWHNPDELRAGLTSGNMELFVLPTQVAANLYNRGLGIRLVNVMTNGLLYVVSRDETIASLADLKGRSVALPYRNDTPDLLFRRLLSAAGLAPDLDLSLQFTGSPLEAIQLLLIGRADAALVPEPSASAAIQRAGAKGIPLFRVIDVQKEWGAATGKPPLLPQAGLGISESFLQRRPAAVAAVQEALIDAAASVNADPAGAAADATDALQLSAAVLEQSIRYSNLVATPARDARQALEAMYGEIVERQPEVIGGRLPDSAFYL